MVSGPVLGRRSSALPGLVPPGGSLTPARGVSGVCSRRSRVRLCGAPTSAHEEERPLLGGTTLHLADASACPPGPAEGGLAAEGRGWLRSPFLWTRRSEPRPARLWKIMAVSGLGVQRPPGPGSGGGGRAQLRRWWPWGPHGPAHGAPLPVWGVVCPGEEQILAISSISLWHCL